MKPDFTSLCPTPPKPLGVFTLGVPRGIGEFVDGIRAESWRPGSPESVSSLFSRHGDRLPLASETPQDLRPLTQTLASSSSGTARDRADPGEQEVRDGERESE